MPTIYEDVRLSGKTGSNRPDGENGAFDRREVRMTRRDFALAMIAALIIAKPWTP
jgi:hypothetical protein